MECSVNKESLVLRQKRKPSQSQTELLLLLSSSLLYSLLLLSQIWPFRLFLLLFFRQLLFRIQDNLSQPTCHGQLTMGQLVTTNSPRDKGEWSHSMLFTIPSISEKLFSTGTNYSRDNNLLALQSFSSNYQRRKSGLAFVTLIQIICMKAVQYLLGLTCSLLLKKNDLGCSAWYFLSTTLDILEYNMTQ